MAELKFADGSRLSHAYIVSARSGEEALDAARRISAAAVCARGTDVPCGQCRSCRKALSGIHPDVFTVARLTDDKGKKKREIGVDQIRAVSADAHVLPNEAERKVYIVDEAETMNISAQNAALKLLEEPPKGVVFLLCTTNADQLLPTVRSRCAELMCTDGETNDEPETRELAKSFMKAVASGDSAVIFSWCAGNEGMNTLEADGFLRAASVLVSDMLCGRESSEGLGPRELLGLSELLERCRKYLRVNTGVKHIFGLLAADALDEGGNRGN